MPVLLSHCVLARHTKRARATKLATSADCRDWRETCGCSEMGRGGANRGQGRKKGSGTGLKYNKSAATKKNSQPSAASMAMLRAFASGSRVQAGHDDGAPSAPLTGTAPEEAVVAIAGGEA